MDFPGNFPGQDHSWSLEKFKDTFKIVISELSHDFMEFDLIGVDASVANAFRRILISEVGIWLFLFFSFEEGEWLMIICSLS